jgi:hypothetical protein
MDFRPEQLLTLEVVVAQGSSAQENAVCKSFFEG